LQNTEEACKKAKSEIDKLLEKKMRSRKMTSREMVLTALEHKEPDRIPVDLGGMGSTGIMGMAYNKLKKYWGMGDGITRIYDTWQQLALPEEEILKKVGADILPVFIEPKGWKKWTLPDGSPCEIPEDFNPEILPDGSQVIKDDKGIITARMPKGGFYFDGLCHPLKDAKTTTDIENYDWQYHYNKEDLENLRTKAKYLYENIDYALMGNNAGSVSEWAQGLRGWDIFMMDLAINQEFAGYLLDKIVEVNIERVKQYIGAVGDFVQVIQVGDDLGVQNGLQMSPELYRKMIKPRQKKFYQFIKDNTDAYLFLHSCGSIYELIPDLIEIGVDIINPVQVTAKNMDSKRFKKEFGRDVTIWGGGCDTQHVLPFGSPAEVGEEVKRRIDDFAPGGGFIFAQVHNIQVGVPPQNIAAMYQKVNDYGKY